MTNKDWEDKFTLLMKQDLMDVPSDFFDEELYFTDPHELNNIFTELEEKNLFMIIMRQEVEQESEELKNEYVQI